MYERLPEWCRSDAVVQGLIESINPAARGVVLRGDITEPANWRAVKPLDDWLKGHNLPGVCGVDTRAITRRIRDGGAPSGVVVHAPDGKFDIAKLRKVAVDWPGLDGMDLAVEVTTKQTYSWDETKWALGKGYGKLTKPKYHVVAVDYGAKRTGLALSDETAFLASSLEQFEAESDEAVLNQIAAVVSERGVAKVVVGLPRNMDGSYGQQAQRVLRFVEALRAKVSVPVETWDERLTTVSADRILREGDLSRAKRKVRRDMIAAQILLQNYLDANAQ